MSGTLLVTPEKLLAAAGEFNHSSSAVSGLTKQMVSMADGLKSVWTGEAASAFHQKFHQLDDDIQRLIRMIQEHVKDLQEMAQAYNAAERQAKETVSALLADPIQ